MRLIQEVTDVDYSETACTRVDIMKGIWTDVNTAQR